MRRFRDSRKSKVYAAEGTFIAASRKFETWDEVVKFGEHVVRGRLARKYRPGLARYGVTFKRTSGNNSNYSRREIHLTRWGWSVGVILHEIAHMINPDSGADAPHGRSFRRVYYDLVKSYGGKGAHQVLRKGFVRHHLTFTKARARRLITPEQREVLVARMLVARQARTGKKKKAAV